MGAVIECAVFGVHDEIKSVVPLALIVLSSAEMDIHTSEIEREVVELVRKRVGPVASLKKVGIVPALPKTRSGKILRNVLRSMANGKEKINIPGTIEDRSVLIDVKRTLDSIGYRTHPDALRKE